MVVVVTPRPPAGVADEFFFLLSPILFMFLRAASEENIQEVEEWNVMGLDKRERDSY